MVRNRRDPCGSVLTRTAWLLALAAMVCAVGVNGAPVSPLEVTVSIPPQKWLVEQVAGTHAVVGILVEAGQSPESFAPTPKQVARLHGADVYFSAGMAYEISLLPRLAAMPGAPLAAGRRPINGGHSHRGDAADPHAWLDPLQAAAFADTVCRVLSVLRPELSDDFARGRSALQARLRTLDQDIAARLGACVGGEIFVFHPAFGHFAARYGLRQIAVEDDGHEPGARHLAETIERARSAGARAIIVQPQFPRRSAEAVAGAIGVPLVMLDPLAADYEANLRHIADTVYDVLGCAERPKGKP